LPEVPGHEEEAIKYLLVLLLLSISVSASDEQIDLNCP